MDAVGPYRIEGEVGRGGAGVVLRGRAPDGTPVAVKLLLKADPTLAARFARERRLHDALAGGGGFVPVLDAGQSPRGPYLVLPLLPGGTLRDRLGKGRWRIADAVRLGRTLAKALGRAHAEGVLHRDLKPENVLYDGEGQPLIADLGLGKHLDPGASVGGITQTGTLSGTLGYAAPEQMLDAKRVGPAADVFALGAILYECLAGEPAFRGGGAVEVANRMLTDGATPLAELRPEVPGAVAAVVERCLAADPADRYPDGAAVATALLRAEGRGARTVGHARRGPALVPVGLAVAGVTLAAGVVAVTRPGAAPATAPPPAAPGTGRPPGPRPAPPAATEAPRRPAVTEAPPVTEAPAATEVSPVTEVPATEAPPVTEASPVTEAPATEAPPAPVADRPDVAAPPPRPGTLAAQVAGLGGLAPQERLGSDERRFEAPLRFVAANRRDLLGLDAAGNVRGFDARDLRQTFSYRVVDTPPTGFAATPDGSAMAVAIRGRIVVTPAGGDVSAADVFRVTVGPDPVSALALGVDPPLLVYAEGRRVRVLHRGTRALVADIASPDAEVTALDLAAGRLVTADARGRLLSFRVGARREDCAAERALGSHGRAVACLALATDGALVASGDVGGVWAIWDTATGAPRGKLGPLDAGAPLAARFVDDDRTLLAAMERAVLRVPLADPGRGARHPLGRPSARAAFSPSGARQVMCDPGGYVLGAVDLAAQRELTPDPGHYAPVSGGAACDAGVYTTDLSGRVLFWGRDGRMTPVHSVGLTPDEPDGAPPSLAAARDGRAMAVARGRAFALDRAGGAPRELPGLGLTWVTTAADGRLLAGTAAGEVLWLDGAGRVLERRATFEGRALQVVQAGATVLALGVEGPRHVVVGAGPGVDLRADVPAARPGALAGAAGGRAVVGTTGGALLVLGPAGGAPRSTQAHAGAVLAVAVSPDGRTLLSAGADDALAAWRVEDGGALAPLGRRALEAAGDAVRSLTPLADGRLLVGSARGVGLLARWGR